MHTGMLWFDNSHTTLSMKIQRAADYYEKKYGRAPDLCLVHPSTMDSKAHVDGVEIRTYRPVLPGHIWVGIQDKE